MYIFSISNLNRRMSIGFQRGAKAEADKDGRNEPDLRSESREELQSGINSGNAMHYLSLYLHRTHISTIGGYSK